MTESTGIDRITGNDTSVAIKATCVVAVNTNITLSGIQTIDGVLLQAGGPSSTGTATPDRVLVMGQTDQTTNGIYLVNSSTWLRAYDFNGTRDAVQGTLVFVRSGTTYGGTWWRVTTTDNPIEFGVSNITFTQLSIPGTVAGTNGQLQYNNNGSVGGLTISGDATLASSTGALTISSGAVTSSKLGTMSANAVLGNASSATALPSAVSLSANQLLGRGSGNIQGVSSGYGIAISSTLGLNPTYVANTISSDISVATSTAYYDGPSVAISSIGGTWYLSGSVGIAYSSTGTPNMLAKLWDGTTVIDSGIVNLPAAGSGNIHLSGIIASPSSNVKISVQTGGAAGTTTIKLNNSGGGKDSTLTAIRLL